MRDYSLRVVLKDLSQFSKVYFVPLADFHEGARDADHEISDGYINWIAEHDAFTILNGDMMNCAWKDSTPELWTGARARWQVSPGRPFPTLA